MSNEDEDPSEPIPLVIDEADFILPTEPFLLPDNDGARDSIVADEIEAEENREPLYEDAGPASIGILNAFQGIFDKPSLPGDGIALPTTEIRPFMRREGSRGQNTAPPPPVPPHEMPPPPLSSEPETTEIAQDGSNIGAQSGTDSLSLQQLRALVREMPGKAEPAPYAFLYGDKASLMEELEEWFAYNVDERTSIAKTHSSFAREWGRFNEFTFANDEGNTGGESSDWARASESKRNEFVAGQLRSLKSEGEVKLNALETLVYLALGCWYETAGVWSKGWMETETSGKVQRVNSEESVSSIGGYIDRKEESRKMLEARYGTSGLQIKWIRRNVLMILENGGAQALVDVFKTTVGRECDGEIARPNVTITQREAEQRETWCAATLLYIGLEITQSCNDTERKLSLRKDFLQSKPNILVFLGDVINSLRWDENIELPLVKILLLTWKATLVLLGGLEDVAVVKESFQEKDPNRDKTSKPTITASPIDYHSFRQEITSKYPAYVPPTGKFPIEPDQKSILPPLRQSNSRMRENSFSAPAAQHGSSLFHQPVHIATPAPSPPPSPAAGKGGKKQNYQTNQMFPFLYPPLDPTSNNLGGKGRTFMQDSLVSRPWEGRDIPVSILEASELFSSRIRATRALTQLWDARQEFMRYERGWVDEQETNIDIDIADLTLDSDDEIEERPIDGPVEEPENNQRTIDGSVQDRLDTVEEIYRDGLPHLQSIVVVVLKTILSTLTSLITNPTASIYENGNGTTQANGPDATHNFQYDLSNLSLDDLEVLRTQEITAKAASGLMLLLLKWFKVSHVLKFEYLCQLLVDANYVPIILKLLQSQEMERIVNCKADRTEFNLFYYCHSISRTPFCQQSPPFSGAPVEQPQSDSSEDECAPPPILKRRRDVVDMPPPPPPLLQSRIQQPPEVDELGLPTTDLPSSPITHFSWRNFFSSINFLRVLQKTCKHKAHRNLMLVQYKSAAYLKKALRVPQRELRLYTLKLFKNQVPYCGRKWRQGNMRVITAVYLHCRPELRDDWLLSADVDNDVEMAVPMEQSLRALTHYYNLKHFSKKMGGGQDVDGFGLAERDFFEQELDKLEWVDDDMEYQDQQGQQMWESGFEHL